MHNKSLLCLSLGLSLISKAQAEEKTTERVEVTGSHIRRMDVEGPSPLTTIDREAIKESGEFAIGDILRNDTSNSFGSRRENSGGNASGSSYIDLRGLGTARTLVLMNGKRLSRDVQDGGIDLNMIPTAAIERVEILRDGASATYGSDALGGVVNIITRKDFNGAQLEARTKVPEQAGGADRTYTFTSGGSSERTRYLHLVQYREADAINANQRSYLHPNWAYAGSPGSFKGAKSGSWTAAPDCPIERKGIKGACGYDVGQDSIRKPKLNQLSLFSNIDYQVNDDLSLSNQFYATRKRSSWYWSPTADERNINLPAAARDTVAQGAGYPDLFNQIPAGQDVVLQFRPVELGRESKDQEATSFGLSSTLSGHAFSDWDWSVSGSQDRKNENEWGDGVALKDRLEALIASGTYNPFKPEGERGSIESARFQPWVKRITQTREFDARLSGPIADWEYGTLAVAVGAETRREEYSERTDSETLNGNTWGTIKGNSGQGGRDVSSSYVELSVPAYKNLELQIAGRFDKYSDFGSAASPKLAMTWRPLPMLFTRASWGTGFKAPTLFEMYREENLQYTTWKDYYLCTVVKPGTKCSDSSGYIFQSGNRDLDKETSEFQNFGIGIEPLKGLSVNVDYWAQVINDTIGYVDISDLTRAEAAGTDIGSFGASITRDDTTHEITSVRTVYQNLGRKELSGIDSELSYNLPTDSGRYSFKSSYSSQLKYKQSGYPGAPLLSVKGYSGKPVWRSQNSVGYSRGIYRTSLHNDIVGPQKNGGADIADYWTLDWFGSIQTAWKGEISLGVKDIFNRPLADVNQRLYSFSGRSYSFGYQQSL